MRFKLGICLMVASTSIASPALAAEWWHGSFMDNDSSASCEEFDATATYSNKQVKLAEGQCVIDKRTPLTGMKGVILDMRCISEGEDQGKSRELLLDEGNGKIYRYPGSQVLRRCDVAPTTAAACPQANRVYRANDFRGSGYQELRFDNGTTIGTVTLTHFLNGQPAWAVNGDFGCSNGASICSLTFSTTSGDEVSFPYEIVSNGGDENHTVVAPSMRQSTYYKANSSVAGKKGFVGLDGVLLGGYVPGDDMLLPYNVYEFDRCADINRDNTKKPKL